jgi:solute carrier family 25 aspartate/glutamate transporter 12/13
MATATTVKEVVKESLLGTEETPNLSAQTRATFQYHARKDAETGELIMGEEQFINAIAPKNEDYVSCSLRSIRESRSIKQPI